MVAPQTQYARVDGLYLAYQIVQAFTTMA